MTTELVEVDRWSTTDTDLSAPEPDKAECARAEVVRAWSTERRSPASRIFIRLHLTGEETYDIDTESWRHFDKSLSLFGTFAHFPMAFPTEMTERRTLWSEFVTYSVKDMKRAERRRRYAELSKLLDEWANDPSDFDEHVDPLIAEALRETSPRHFPDK